MFLVCLIVLMNCINLLFEKLFVFDDVLIRGLMIPSSVFSPLCLIYVGTRSVASFTGCIEDLKE